MKYKNVFFKPIADELSVFEDNGNLTVQIYWSFSIFNIFDSHRTVQADQSVLLNESIENDDITLRLHGDKSNKLIPFKISDINN